MDDLSATFPEVNFNKLFMDFINTPAVYSWAVGTAMAAFFVYIAVWRLYMSPIAQFPGPRLAALTHLYEIYYNNWLGGKYVYRVAAMHREYGPIVRISPTDLHIGDPDFYDTLYPSASSKRRVNKTPSLTKFFGLDDSLFSTIDHDTHRMRRAALNPYFSTLYVRKLQPVIQERLNVLLQRLNNFKDTDQAVNANCMYAALSNDLMQMLTFGQHSSKLETPDFDSTERDASLNGAMSFHITKRLPWLNDLMMSLPQVVIKHINPSLSMFMEQKHITRQKVEKLSSMPKTEWAGKETQPVALSLLESAKLPPAERKIGRVAQDAEMVLMAGTLTTATTLEHLLFWMIDNPDVLRKLKEELKGVMPTVNDLANIPLTTLEGLPYLTAVLKEATRLIYGNTTPHFRSNPDTALVFQDTQRSKTWVIPPNTSVGMTSVILHHDERHFPNSWRFDPDRWLGEEGKKLDRYNVGFGKGGRICLGMNQAYGIMRLVMAQTWRLWASPDVSIGDEIGVIKLYNTTAHDVKMNGDFFIPAYNKPQGVEFKVFSR